MKKLQGRLAILSMGLLAAITMLTMPGCEDEPSTGGLDGYFAANPYISDPRTDPGPLVLDLSPLNATVTSVGQQVLFRVRGGKSPYKWGVSRPDRGTVQGDPASSDGVYTALKVAANDVIVSDAVGHAAIASINGTASAMTITPASATLTATETNMPPASLTGQAIVFKVTGGVPPYGNWAVSVPSLGIIGPQTGVYVALGIAIGDNTVSITDSMGNIKTATVKHQLAN